MGFRERVVEVANGENGINWHTDADRILEYFLISTGQRWTRESARKISWCTYFAHWVLSKAGVQPLPQVGAGKLLDPVGGAVGRFLHYSEQSLKATKHTGNGVYEFHSAVNKSYTPQPGDLYYRGHAHNDHVGVIVGVTGREIWTVDGNAGPRGFDKRYFVSYPPPTGLKLIGDAFVYKALAPKTLGNEEFFIAIPDQ